MIACAAALAVVVHVVSTVGASGLTNNSHRIEAHGDAVHHVVVANSPAWQTTPTMDPMAARIEELALLSHDWDGDGAVGPTQIAATAARDALAILNTERLYPDAINADALGGIVFEFYWPDQISQTARWLFVECSNDGSVYVTQDDFETESNVARITLAGLRGLAPEWRTFLHRERA